MNFIKSFKSKKAVLIMSLDEEGFLTMNERTKDKVGNNNIFVCLDYIPNLETFLSKVQK